MKQAYQTYMDSVEVSPALHQKLLGLSAPRREIRWRRYGSLAAALVVLIGTAAFVLGRLGANRDLFTPHHGSSIGGYEVLEGDASTYVELPYIAYGTDSTGSSLVDYALLAPEGSVERELTEADILTLVGGETALETHLGWEGLSWSGQGIFLSDGSLWHLYLWGEGPDLAVSLDLLAGNEIPPDCVVTEADTVTDVMGVSVKGYVSGIYGKDDEETGETVVWLPESRTVEFAANGAGYRFQVYGSEGESQRVEMLVSRFVRLAIADGLNLTMTPAEQ